MSAVPEFRLATVALLRTTYPDDAVTYGPPVALSPRMAYVNAARIVKNDQPSSSGGRRRSRDEVAELDVVLSCYVPGDALSFDDAQQQAVETAYEMYDALEDVFRDRDSDQLTAGGRDARIDHADDEVYPAQETDSDGNSYITGWICDLTATVTITTRLA